jgi:NAD(P)-dependent dehydrogenase (short-subunit alcohol dehydrogenase family)
MSDITQVVLVTGANQGLGYEVALQLAKLPGYHILVGARSQEKGAEAVSKIRAAEGVVSKLEPILVDLDSDETIHAAIKTVESKFGKLDVLVVSTSSHRDCHHTSG